MTRREILTQIAAKSTQIEQLEAQVRDLGKQLSEEPIGWLVVYDLRGRGVTLRDYTISATTPTDLENGVRVRPTVEDPEKPLVSLELIDGVESTRSVDAESMGFNNARWSWSSPGTDPEFMYQLFESEGDAEKALTRNFQLELGATRHWAVISLPATDEHPAMSTLHRMRGLLSEVEPRANIRVALQSVGAPRVPSVLAYRTNGSDATGWYRPDIGIPETLSVDINGSELQITVTCFSTEAEARAAMPLPEADTPSAGPIDA